MKKFVLTYLFGLMVCMGLNAQNDLYSGVVRDTETGDPLIGANILVESSSTGVITDLDGKFEISASPGDVLVITYVGYPSKSVTLGNQKQLNIKLSAGALLDEVVVTALGISREKKALGYSISQFDTDDVANSGQDNIIGVLQGRTPGVQIQGSGGAPGAGLDILIRGITSLDPSRNNRPLYVIDGVEISDDVDVAPILPSGADFGLSTSSRTQGITSNRLIDINPDDIASMSVLKGAAATALYGVRAANGAIIITTKKGEAGDPVVTFGYSMGLSEINKTPKVQTDFIDGHRSTSLKRSFLWDNWGAIVTDQTISQPKNIYDEFYQTGNNLNMNLGISAGTERFTYRFSGGYTDQTGIIPLSDFKRGNLSLSGAYQVNSRFKIDASMNYSNVRSNSPHEGRKSIMNVLAYMANTTDPRNFIEPYTYGGNFAAGIIDHPLFLANNVTNYGEVDRYITSVGLQYSILPSLVVRYKFGIDSYADARERIVHPETDEGQSGVPGSPFGFMAVNNINRKAITSNLSLNWAKDLTADLNLSLTLGQYIYTTDRQRNTIIGGQFEVENFYNLSNTLLLQQDNDLQRYRNAAVYGDATLGYKNYLYLSLTGRNDWTSTLPVENRSYFFPSTSLSWVVSDMVNLTNVDLLKLRASYAIVGKDANTYAVGDYYEKTLQFGDVIGYTQSTSIGDINLKPEFTNTFEIGAEVALLNNRIGFDASYYNSNVKDMILGVPVTNSSGVARFITNAGSLTNQGFEFLVYGDLFRKTDGFNWTATLNWSRNVGKVESIDTDSEDNEIVIADIRNVTNKLIEGGNIADLYGRPFSRNEEGRLIIDNSGLPSLDNDTLVLMGNGLPDFIAGLTNDLSYKNWGLSFLWEWKKGGDVIDISRSYSIDNGQLEETNGRYQRVIFDGVKTDGSENDIVAEITAESFYRNSARFRYAPEAFLQDASWLRLRSLSLSYELPLDKMNIDFISEAKIAFIGTNLFLDTPYNGFDPEANFFGASSNIYGYTGLRTPSTKSYNLKLNLTF